MVHIINNLQLLYVKSLKRGSTSQLIAVNTSSTMLSTARSRAWSAIARLPAALSPGRRVGDVAGAFLRLTTIKAMSTFLILDVQVLN